MKWIINSIIICLLGFLLVSCSDNDNSSNSNSLLGNFKILDGYLSEADFNELFPHANERPSSISDADPNLYSYNNMKKGLRFERRVFCLYE